MLRIHRLKMQQLIILILVFATDSYIVFSSTIPRIRTFFQGVLFLIVLTFLLYKRSIKLKKIIYFLLLALPVFLSMIVNNDFSGGNLIKIFMMFAGMVISNNIELENFKSYFSNIVYFIAGFSLVTYILSGFIVSHETLFPVIVNTSGTRVAFLGLSNVALSDGFPRNYGPFWEPGVYAIYLCLALLFNMKAGTRPRFKDVLVILTIVTTFSTLGIMLLALVIVEYAYLQVNFDENGVQKKASESTRFIVLSLIFLSVIYLFFNDHMKEILFAKFNKADYRYMSTAARMNSITGNLIIWKEHPIFGVGAAKITSLYENFVLSKGGWDLSNTNGLLTHFSMYGVVEGLGITLCIYKFARVLRKNIMSVLIVFLIFVLMLTAEPLMTSILLNTIIFYGIQNNEVKGLMWYEQKEKTKNCGYKCIL